MSPFADIPLPLGILVAALVVLGAAFALIGSIGLLRLGSFYDRVHPPTLGTTFGTALIALASMLLFSALESRLVLHELVIIAFVVVTTPVTFMLLVRAALLRDQAEGRDPSSVGASRRPDASNQSERAWGDSRRL